MAKWLVGLTAVLTELVRASPDCRFSVQCKVIALPAFYDAITGPTEFIISLFNSVKMVNMPKAPVPLLGSGKSLCKLLHLLFYESHSKLEPLVDHMCMHCYIYVNDYFIEYLIFFIYFS